MAANANGPMSATEASRRKAPGQPDQGLLIAGGFASTRQADIDVLHIVMCIDDGQKSFDFLEF
jgi:hypothetical protein